MKFNAVTLMVHGPGQIDDTVCRGEAEYLENVVVGKLCSLRRNCFHFGHGFSRGEAYVYLLVAILAARSRRRRERPLRLTRLKLQG